MNFLELNGALFAIANTWLTAKQKVIAWPIGILSASIYLFIFYHAYLYSDAGLQVFYILMFIYGWYCWLQNPNDDAAKSFSTTDLAYSRGFFGLFLVMLISTGLGFIMQNYTDASFAYLDAALASASVWAIYLTTRKIIQCWLVWIAIDCLEMIIFVHKQLYITAILYLIFCGIAVVGYLQWKKLKRLPAKLENKPF